MDMAFLNAFLTAQTLPTQDTWLAGFSVPYYYFGYFVLACVGKLSGVEPGVAYNLAAATVPALAMVGLSFAGLEPGQGGRAFQTAWSAAGAATATVLALFCGNLGTFFEYLVSRGLLSPDAGRDAGHQSLRAKASRPGVWPPVNESWWFNASRIIPNLKPDGIDEFPFFSALLSDLHPHFVALPFELLVLSRGSRARGESRRDVTLDLDPGPGRPGAGWAAGHQYVGHRAVLAAVRRLERVRRLLERVALALGGRGPDAAWRSGPVRAVFCRLRRTAAGPGNRRRPHAARVAVGAVRLGDRAVGGPRSVYALVCRRPARVDHHLGGRSGRAGADHPGPAGLGVLVALAGGAGAVARGDRAVRSRGGDGRSGSAHSRRQCCSGSSSSFSTTSFIRA